MIGASSSNSRVSQVTRRRPRRRQPCTAPPNVNSTLSPKHGACMGLNAHHNIRASLNRLTSLATVGPVFLRRVVRAERAGDRLRFVIDADDIRAGSVSDELARIQPVRCQLSIRGPAAVPLRVDTHDVRRALASTGEAVVRIAILARKTRGNLRFAMRKLKRRT